MRPLARLTIMMAKLPMSSQRRGLTSFQTSGITLRSLGFGRAAVISAAMPRPVLLRAGRSARIPPKPPYPIDPMLALSPACLLCVSLLDAGAPGSDETSYAENSEDEAD